MNDDFITFGLSVATFLIVISIILWYLSKDNTDG